MLLSNRMGQMTDFPAYPALGAATRRVTWHCNYCQKSGTLAPDFEMLKTAESEAVDDHDRKSPTCEGLTITLEVYYEKGQKK